MQKCDYKPNPAKAKAAPFSLKVNDNKLYNYLLTRGDLADTVILAGDTFV